MTSLKQSKKSNVATAEAAIRHGILNGRFAQGQRMIEIDLMEEYGVSRGNIREIFRNLESEGIVTIEKNRGASVRKISRKEVTDTFEVLETITLLALKKIAKKAKEPETKKALKESLGIVKAFNKELDQHNLVQDYMAENVRFWGSIGDLAGNPVLEETRARLQLPLYRLQIQGLFVNSARQKWLTLHEELLTALLAGDQRKVRSYALEAQRDVLDAMINLPSSAYLD